MGETDDDFKLARPELPKQSEVDVKKDHRTFLELHGWKVLNMPSGRFQKSYKDRKGLEYSHWVNLGEPGMPDMIALHPTMHRRGKSGVLWLEIKAIGGRLSKSRVVTKTRNTKWGEQRVTRRVTGQDEYIRALRAAGFVAVFSDNLDDFRRWYEREFGH